MALTAILCMGSSAWLPVRIRMSLALFLIDGMQGGWVVRTLIPRGRARKDDILRLRRVRNGMRS